MVVLELNGTNSFSIIKLGITRSEGGLTMISYTKRQKCCATCQYWEGERKLSSSKTNAEVQPNVKGKCQRGHGQNQPSGSSCMSWTAWGSLK